MAELIGSIIGFMVVYGIPCLVDKSKEKKQIEKNTIEFMKKSFGEDYQERMKRWERGE